MTLLGQRTAVWRAGSVSCDAFPCLASWLWREGTKEPNARSTFNPKPGIQFKPVSIQVRLGYTVTKVSWQKIGFKSVSQTYHQLSSIHFFTSTVPKTLHFPATKLSTRTNHSTATGKIRTPVVTSKKPLRPARLWQLTRRAQTAITTEKWTEWRSPTGWCICLICESNIFDTYWYWYILWY
jgi:hypothetical protein